MSQELLDAIDDRRHARTYRSAWVRQACIARMLAEAADEWDDDVPAELDEDVRDDLNDGAAAVA